MRAGRGLENKKWRVILYILYIDMILLIIRSVYRVAEYGSLKHHNPISTNETYFYTLDTLEMLILNILWIPFHPGFWDMLNDKTEEDHIEFNHKDEKNHQGDKKFSNTKEADMVELDI